ncbi:MAG: WD40 repeat domain-containing protein, partial [Limnospira sp. PMC 1286.21]
DVLLNPEQTETLQLIAGTLRLSTHILASDTTQLAEQLWGRLLSFENPEIVALLEQAKQAQKKPWFRPLTTNFTPPGGPLIRTLTGHSSGVSAVAITPDGKQAVSASFDKTLKLWDLATGSQLATFTGHSGSVYAVAITPDGKQAVSASGDNTLKMWDFATRNLLATFRGHRGKVRAVAIAPDGKRAVSASSDNTLKLWDLATGSQLATFRGHSGL